jgi:general secretion pathway protein D
MDEHASDRPGGALRAARCAGTRPGPQVRRGPSPLATIAFAVLLTGTLTACETLEKDIGGPPPQPAPRAQGGPAQISQGDKAQRAEALTQYRGSSVVDRPPDGRPEPDAIQMFKGTGRFIGDSRAPAGGDEGEGAYTLNFQGTDIDEVAKTILGDILHVNYVMDDKVKGQVNLQTSQPLSRADLITVLEAILGMNNAVMVKDGVLYKIMPKTDQLSAPFAPRYRPTDAAGYQMVVVPLRYVSATEMKKVIESFHKGKGVVEADKHRNLLILRGSPTELRNLMELISSFDVNQLKGKSVGIFRLSSVDADTLIKELEEILDASKDGPLSDMVHFVEIQRINAILAISSQPRYLEEVKLWVERLDHAELSAGKGLYVYFVQNGDAGHLAEILQELFASRSERHRFMETVQVAPGLRPTVKTARAAGRSERRESGVPRREGTRISGALAGSETRVAVSGSRIEAQVGDVNIIADEERNALIVMASPEDYARIEKTLRKLDILPLQVLIEASIIEVSLTGDLSYGVEWFFKNSLGKYTGEALLDLGTGGLAAAVPGFSYSIIDSSGDVRAVINTLASDSRINVISSPSLMVLDNNTATINVGDQVPVLTSTSSSTGTSGDNPVIVSTIQYIDTGVILDVTPRVNQGGTVIMEIQQEVKLAKTTTTSSIDSPTINQRQIKTSVAVQSGETIVLGGLIRDDKQHSNSGFPGLRKLPLIGPLFGTTDNASARTELLVLITPTAITNSEEARQATEELKRKLKGLVIPESHGGAPPAL